MPSLKHKFIARVMLPYVLLATLWIYLSDRVLAALVTDPALHTRLQTFKDMAFILVTTALVYWLMWRELRKRRRAESWRNGQNQVLTQLVSGAPLHTVLETVALAMETQVTGAIGSILLLDPDARHLRFGAAPHLPGELSRALDGMEIGPAAGACGTAAHDRALVIIEDFETDPRGLDYRELSRRFQLRACWSQPVLTAGGEVLGTFAMYYRAPRRPTAEEQRLIAEAGNLVAVAIETTRNRDALAESESRFRATFEQAAVGIAHVAPDGRFLRINRKFCDIVGYSREEMLAGAFQDITHPEDLNTDLDYVKRVLAGEIPTYSMEKRYRHKNGSLVWVNLTVALVRKHDGAPDYFISVVEDIMARKQAEQALQQSEQRLRNIIDGLGPSMFVGLLTTEGVVLEANQQALAAAGLKPEDVLGKPVEETYWFSYSEESKRRMRATVVCAAQGQAARYDLQIRVAENQFIPLDFSVQPFRDATGKVVLLVPSAIVITERKQAEQTLREREHFLRRVLDTEPGTVYIYDLAQRGNVFINRHWLNAYGYTAEETQAMGETLLARVFHPDDLARIAAHHEAWRQAGADETRNIEYRVRAKTGEWRWLHSRETVFARDAAGQVSQILGIAHDVTARKQAEENLRANERQLRLFVEHSPAAIAMFDKEMRYLVASHRWLEDYGLGDQDLTGRSHYEVFPEIPQRWKDIHRRCLAGAIERSEEDPFPRPDGRTDWVRWEVRPWRQAKNEIGGIIIFSEVVTARKQAEQTIAENAARLARLSRQLLAAQETERRRVAHELHDEIGQLLTVVKLDLQTVLHQPGTTALAPALKEGMESIDRVVARVRDLSLDLRPSMLDDLGLVPTLRWYVQRQAQRLGAGVEVTLTLPPALPRLPGEIETACFRVAQEALTNTTRHAGATRIEVTLAAGKNDLELTVHDNGAGFDVGAVSRRTAGAGFGLLGMQERAELTGGQLTIVSTPGQGTTVRARFPTITIPEPAA